MQKILEFLEKEKEREKEVLKKEFERKKKEIEKEWKEKIEELKNRIKETIEEKKRDFIEREKQRLEMEMKIEIQKEKKNLREQLKSELKESLKSATRKEKEEILKAILGKIKSLSGSQKGVFWTNKEGAKLIKKYFPNAKVEIEPKIEFGFIYSDSEIEIDATEKAIVEKFFQKYKF